MLIAIRKIIFLSFFLTYFFCQSKVDIIKTSLDINLDYNETILFGDAVINLMVSKKSKNIYFNSKELEYYAVSINGQFKKIIKINGKIWIEIDLYPLQMYQIELKYISRNKKIFTELEFEEYKYYQGFKNNTWLPVNNPNDKCEWDIKISSNNNSRYFLFNALPKEDIDNKVHFFIKNPVSSRDLFFMISKNKFNLLKSERTIMVNNFSTYDYYQNYNDLFDKIIIFLEKKIGKYKLGYLNQFFVSKLANNIEAKRSNFFNINLLNNPILIDSLIKSFTYQTAKKWFEDSDDSIKEIFSIYYSWKAAQEFLGQDIFYWILFENMEKQKNVKNNKIPVYLSENYPVRGAWMLYDLETILGENKFDELVRIFIKNNFQDINSLKKMIINHVPIFFVQKWFINANFPIERAEKIMENNSTIMSYKKIIDLRNVPLLDKQDTLEKIITGTSKYIFKKEAIMQLPKKDYSSGTLNIIEKAFKIKDPYLNIFILNYYDEIPKSLENGLKNLICDNSFYLDDKLLLKICFSFPDKCDEYISDYITSYDLNYSNYNVLLAKTISNIFIGDNKLRTTSVRKISEFLREGNLALRENAFLFLYQNFVILDEDIKLLIKYCNHPNKNFAGFCKKLIEEARKNDYYKKRIEIYHKE